MRHQSDHRWFARVRDREREIETETDRQTQTDRQSERVAGVEYRAPVTGIHSTI